MAESKMIYRCAECTSIRYQTPEGSTIDAKLSLPQDHAKLENDPDFKVSDTVLSKACRDNAIYRAQKQRGDLSFSSLEKLPELSVVCPIFEEEEINASQVYQDTGVKKPSKIYVVSDDPRLIQNIAGGLKKEKVEIDAVYVGSAALYEMLGLEKVARLGSYESALADMSDPEKMKDYVLVLSDWQLQKNGTKGEGKELKDAAKKEGNFKGTFVIWSKRGEDLKKEVGEEENVVCLSKDETSGVVAALHDSPEYDSQRVH
ncbi:hypothetical protein ACFLZX_04060 [Nanoarchaeota archaeon]